MGKKEKILAAGVTSFFTVYGGILLMMFGGPPGIVAGSTIMSAGLGGGMNVHSQAKNDKDDFSFGEFAGHAVVNGAATAGVGVGL